MICLIVIDTCSMILNIISSISCDWAAKIVHTQGHANALFYWHAKLPLFLIVNRNRNGIFIHALRYYKQFQNVKQNKKVTIPSLYITSIIGNISVVSFPPKAKISFSTNTICTMIIILLMILLFHIYFILNTLISMVFDCDFDKTKRKILKKNYFFLTWNWNFFFFLKNTLLM